MRYLGSKESLVPYILNLLNEKGLLNTGNNLIFFDGFCGMGSVSNGLIPYYDVVINDILNCSVVYTQSRILSNDMTFEGLGFNPFEFLNKSPNIVKGFFYNNYTPGGSNRMYFTEFNGGRIDYFRQTIEWWKKDNLLTQTEYIYLLGCLLEAISSVANTAGVYGAFLKHWDNRALKEIRIQSLQQENLSLFSNMRLHRKLLNIYTNRLEDIIQDIQCDILYLDPPYTQNQYGTQYHLLETVILNDNPPISAITGSRPTAPMRSDWSKELPSHILFDKIVAKTKARYIILSYNNDGFMSKDYIEATLKRYGIPKSYECKIIDYKKYNNSKCQGRQGHVEYLFFIEKKAQNTVVYESPLNYQGNKSSMIDLIKANIPNDIDLFIDGFGGGFNVGININAKKVIYNDINHFVKGIINFFGKNNTLSNLTYIYKLIQKYNLSTENKNGYLELREKYNSTPIRNRDARMLYTLLLFGFQQQLRFNSRHEFNNPFGTRYFNDKLLSKFISFSRRSREKNVEYLSLDYQDLDKYMTTNSLIYLDPPYLNSSGSYNDGKRGFLGWTKDMELSLCQFCDSLSKKNYHFLLSYDMNDDILKWSEGRGYTIIKVAKPQGRYNSRQEILIKNY